MFVGPSPVWDSESVGMMLVINHDIGFLAMWAGVETYSVQVVHEAGSAFLIRGNHRTCVVSQNLLKVYTGMQMYGKPDFLAAARLMAKHL